MRACAKAVCFSLLVLGMVIAPGAAFSQEEEAAPTEIAGQVTAVDLQKMAVEVKYLKGDGTETTLTVSVDDATVVEIGYEPATLADLKVGDEISIDYYTDESGKNIANGIWKD